jgi:hypothetical protein
MRPSDFAYGYGEIPNDFYRAIYHSSVKLKVFPTRRSFAPTNTPMEVSLATLSLPAAWPDWRRRRGGMAVLGTSASFLGRRYCLIGWFLDDFFLKPNECSRAFA